MMEEQQSAPEAPPTPAPSTGKGMWIGLIVVIIVIVILLAAVFGGLLAPPAAQDKTLKIGTVLSLTGTSGLEAYGPTNQRGVTLAVNEINAAGGVLGNPIVLTNEDDAGVVATARDKAQKLVTTNQVDAIIGAVGSAYCQSILEGVTKANKVIQISASCTSPLFSNLTYTDGWFLRTAPSDALQGVVAANYAYTNRSFRNVGVIGNDNAYGRGLTGVFATKFRALNASNVATVSIFANGKTTYNSELTALITPQTQAIYMANYPTDGLTVMRDWAANPTWANIKWIFSEGLLSQGKFVDQLVTDGINPQTFEGSAPGAYLGIVGALYDGFLARYKAAYSNQDPGLFTANAYDAVYLLAAAAQKAGVATSQGIKDNIRAVAGPPGTTFTGGQWAAIRNAIANNTDINYEGASGAVDIDALGDPFSGYAIWGVNSTNKIVTLHYYPESLVRTLLGAPPAPVIGTRSAFDATEMLAAAKE